jgi:hypothetical protein
MNPELKDEGRRMKDEEKAATDPRLPVIWERGPASPVILHLSSFPPTLS